MTPQPPDFSTVEVLTFDCYGTLVDWESGLLTGLRGLIGGGGANVSDDHLLEAYALAEAETQRGPWTPYRQVLSVAGLAVCRELDAHPSPDELARFGGSVGTWPLFPDSVDALARLAARYELGVITNCDDDLFDASNEKLGRPFRWVVTAEQVRAYKPSLRNFNVALDQIGPPHDRIVHVAQSLYHDHVPARTLGIATAWINRRHDRPGWGATPAAATVEPNVVTRDMAEFAVLALAAS